MMSALCPRFAAAALVMIASVAVALPRTARADDPDPTADTEEPSADDPGAENGTGDNEAPPDERGQENQADRAAAESLLKVGRGLMELGQLEEACDKLQDSIDAFFVGDAAMLLAECQERRGLLASAWASYRQAAARLRKAGDERAVEAAQRAETINARVPRLTITATVVPGFEITRGDTRFDDGILGVALAVDPGTHTLHVSAPGYQTWVGEVVIRPSERKSVNIPPLVAVGVEPKGSTAPAPASSDQQSDAGYAVWWTAGLVTGATGIALVGVGAVLGGLAAADVDQAEDDDALCGADRQCTAAGLEHIARADRLANGATAMFVIGGAAVVAGFVMVLVGGRDDDTEVAITPYGDGQCGDAEGLFANGLCGGGIRVTGRF